MKYRKLGKTGIEVSEIGFGTWGLGGTSYGPVEDNVSIDTLRFAYEKGVTFYDTSDVYGDGHSEEVLGNALRGVRDKVVIATKVGLLPHTGFVMPCDFSPKHIKVSIDGSLGRLRTDYVDLYQLHSPTIEMIREQPEIIPTLEGLKKTGKIRAYGVSVRSPGDALVAVSEFGFDVVQVNFNLIDHRVVENGLLELAGKQSVGLIARTPLCFGYLTGKLDADKKFEGVDHRANWPREQLKRWADAPDLFSFLNNGKDRTPAQLALRFCLDHEGVSTVIPGMMNIREVEENARSSSIERLSAEELHRITLTYNQNVFYDKNFKKV